MTTEQNMTAQVVSCQEFHQDALDNDESRYREQNGQPANTGSFVRQPLQ